MGAWKNAFFLQEKAMSIEFLVLGGGGAFWVFGRGGEGRFYFYGREDFSELCPLSRKLEKNATPYRSLRALRLPQSDLKMSKKCLPRHFKVTFWTLFGPGLQGSLEHSLRHSQAHPAFRGHSLGHFGGDFGPEWPEDSCKGSRLSQQKTFLWIFSSNLHGNFD